MLNPAINENVMTTEAKIEIIIYLIGLGHIKAKVISKSFNMLARLYKGQISY